MDSTKFASSHLMKGAGSVIPSEHTERFKKKKQAADKKAIGELHKQIVLLDSRFKEYTPDSFYELLKNGNNSKIRTRLIQEGLHKGQLTLEQHCERGWKDFEGIKPTDYLSVINQY